MPRPSITPCPDLTPAEFGAMKALWQLGSGSVADVRAHLASVGVDVAYTTVMTLLTRLAAKGAVLVDRTREPFVYRAAYQRDQILRQRLRAFVRDVFDGDAAALVLGLVENDSISASEAADFERRIAEAERVDPPRPRARATASRKRGA